jgi:hypothetical protein
MTETPAEKKTFAEKLKKMFSTKHIIGIAIGIIGGFAYYWFVGSKAGTGSLKSNPWLTMLLCGIMGYLLVDLIPKKKKDGPNNEPPV